MRSSPGTTCGRTFLWRVYPPGGCVLCSSMICFPPLNKTRAVSVLPGDCWWKSASRNIAFVFEVGCAMVSVLNPTDLVVDSIGVNGCLHAPGRAHTQDDSPGDSQNDFQGGSQNGFRDGFQDGFQATVLAVIALQSVFLAEGRRNVAFQVLWPAFPQARSCYKDSRSVDMDRIGAVEAVVVLDLLELAQNGHRGPRPAQIA